MTAPVKIEETMNGFVVEVLEPELVNPIVGKYVFMDAASMILFLIKHYEYDLDMTIRMMQGEDE